MGVGGWGPVKKHISKSKHDTYEHVEKATPSKNGKQRISKEDDPTTIMNDIKQAQEKTWISPGGVTRRQIDYIVINRRCRHTPTRAWAIPGWGENIMQQRHHAAICMTITLKLLKNAIRRQNRKQEYA